MTSLKETPVAAVILAAGMGKRMKSDLPKVLHTVGGKPMLWHVIQQAKAIGADPVVSVLGHKRELVIPVVEETDTLYAVQEEQLEQDMRYAAPMIISKIFMGTSLFFPEMYPADPGYPGDDGSPSP